MNRKQSIGADAILPPAESPTGIYPQKDAIDPLRWRNIVWAQGQLLRFLAKAIVATHKRQQ